MRQKLIEATFLVGGFVLGVALVPTVLAGGGPTLSTSVTTAAVLSAYVVAFIAMNQKVSALGIGVNAVLWAVLAGQAI